jgi:N-acetylglutamate synthase-like GNAT family acetyltransferase
MSRVFVRDAQTDDAAAVSVLLAQLGYSNPESLAREKIALLTEREDDRVFVAHVGGQVVGVLSVHVMPLLHVPGSLGRITALVVDERKRGVGIGRDRASV